MEQNSELRKARLWTQDMVCRDVPRPAMACPA